MTDTKPDLKPNERKVLDSLLALGEATAARVGEHAGLAYSSTTPKLRKLEALGLAEKFTSAANQTLWRAVSTAAAASKDDGTGEVAQATTPATDQPAHPDESGTDGADADHMAPNEPTPARPDTGETAAAPAVEPEAVEPEAVEPEGPGDEHVPDGTTSTAAEATGGDGSPASDTSEDVTAPAGAPAPKAKRKRPAGALEASVLAILQGDPDGQYKINDLRKLVDKADEGTGYPAASAGAIANALDKLVGKGLVIVVPAKHATVQAAPAAG